MKDIYPQGQNRLILYRYDFLISLIGIFLLWVNTAIRATAYPEATPSTYYVDAHVATSGNGLSWSQAFKTIREATSKTLPSGSIIWVKPGIYREDIGIDQSGAAIVPLTTGVQTRNGNQVVFPLGTNLSGIDLVRFPSQYYLYLARSWVGNSGVYPIAAVDVVNHTITVKSASLLPEVGILGDDTTLSAAVGRPIQLRNANPENGFVTLDGTGLNVYTLLYVGAGWVSPCGAEKPVSFITIEGFHLTRAPGGLHIQDASFITFANSRISHVSDTTGVYIDGNQHHPARYNYLIGNEIVDTTNEAIYIGAGGQGEACNYTQFTHILGNTITHTTSWMENAIEVKEHHNRGTVIAGNLIHDFSLDYYWNAAIHLQQGADDSLVYNNELRDVIPNYARDPIFILSIEGGDAANVWTRNVYLFNNLIYNTKTPHKLLYAIRVNGGFTQKVRIYHNTIHNIAGGLYLHDDGLEGTNDVSIENNIFDIPANFPLITEEDWGQTGAFHLSHNLFSRTPETYQNTLYWTGNPAFVNAPNHLRLNQTSVAIDKGRVQMPPLSRDFDLAARDDLPDLGAYEYLKNLLYLPVISR